jgi:hypothetical protein
MARRDIGPRTMTNSEMQDRTTTDVIGKAAGRDQHHSVGSCYVADLTDRCPTCLIKMEWVHSHYQCPRCDWRDSVACERPKRTMPTTPEAPYSTIAARSGGTP